MAEIDSRAGLAERALLLFISRIMVLGLNFAASVLVARGLGPAGRGVYALAILIPVLIAQTVSLGLNGAAVYFTGQARYPLQQVISTLFWTALGLGGAGAILVGWGLGRWGSSFLGEFPLPLLPLALASLPFLVWADLLGHILLGQERTGAFALQAVVQSVILLLIQGGGFLWAPGRVEVALTGWLLSQMAGALTAIILVSRHLRLRFAVNWTFLQEAIRFSRPGYVATWLQFLNFRLDQLLLHTWLGSAALGQYAVAVSLTEAMWQLPTSVGAVLFARVATVNSRERPVSTARVSRLTILVMVGLAIVAAGLARPLITLLFGPAYEGAVPALYALLPGTVALVLPHVIGGDFYGRGLPRYLTYGAGIALLATVTWDILLIPAYGAIGAGLASSLAYSMYGAAVVVMAQRLSREPWFRFLIPIPADWQWLQTVIGQFKQARKSEG